MSLEQLFTGYWVTNATDDDSEFYTQPAHIAQLGGQRPIVVRKTKSSKQRQVEQILQIVSLVLGAYAAYLSWTCNTKQGVSTATKVIFAYFAFMFGPIYLFYYFMFRMEQCK